MNVIYSRSHAAEGVTSIYLYQATYRIRVGILTIAEKWEKRLGTQVSSKTEAYLQKKYPVVSTLNNLLINGAVCPDELLVDTVKSLPDGYFLVKGNLLIAARNPTRR